jgi:glycosyltransferase involved in cell wall biosynthesis
MFYVHHVLPALVRRLDHVLTVSESSRRDILEFAGVREDRVTVTPLGVGHARFRPLPAAQTAPRLKALGVEPPYVLYVARLEHPGKNHVGLIRAFAEFRQRTGLPHRLVLAGPDWTRADEVHREAARSPHAAAIVFPGAVSADDLLALYAGADLFVLPSHYEGFGLPILESMACGVPVACSNTSSMPEVAGDAGVLFDPADPLSIADAMGRVLTDRPLRDELAARSLARAREYTWERTARQTRDVLRRAAGRAGA